MPRPPSSLQGKGTEREATERERARDMRETRVEMTRNPRGFQHVMHSERCTCAKGAPPPLCLSVSLPLSLPLSLFVSFLRDSLTLLTLHPLSPAPPHPVDRLSPSSPSSPSHPPPHPSFTVSLSPPFSLSLYLSLCASLTPFSSVQFRPVLSLLQTETATETGTERQRERERDSVLCEGKVQTETETATGTERQRERLCSLRGKALDRDQDRDRETEGERKRDTLFSAR